MLLVLDCYFKAAADLPILLPSLAFVGWWRLGRPFSSGGSYLQLVEFFPGVEKGQPRGMLQARMLPDSQLY